jgi:hypothetical protein
LPPTFSLFAGLREDWPRIFYNAWPGTKEV